MAFLICGVFFGFLFLTPVVYHGSFYHCSYELGSEIEVLVTELERTEHLLGDSTHTSIHLAMARELQPRRVRAIKKIDSSQSLRNLNE